MAALALSAAGSVQAQVLATVSGHVVDEASSSPLVGAGVTVLDAKGLTVSGAVADAEGRFRIAGLPPGTYRLSVSH